MGESLSLRDTLANYFRRTPHVWIDGKVLATIAGGYGWRTRVSEVRKLGMTIENRVRREHSAGCAKLFAADLEEDAVCDCASYTVSEYRYEPTAAETTPSAGHNLNVDGPDLAAGRLW